MYISVSEICYYQIRQPTIGSLTIDPAFLCGTICRRNENQNDKRTDRHSLKDIKNDDLVNHGAY